MQKAADAADISVLFFSAGANFWAILGHFWAILGQFGSVLGHFLVLIFLAKNVSLLFLLLYASLCYTSAVAASCQIIIIAIAHHSNRHHQERVRPSGAKSRQQRALNPFYLTHKTIRHHYHLCHPCYQHCQHHYQSSLGNVSGKD